VDVRIHLIRPARLGELTPLRPRPAGSRPDTNDLPVFFITSDAYRDGDFQYTIIGKLIRRQ